ncbi:MAG: glycosyltransferase [Pseudomonadota bacterium]
MKEQPISENIFQKDKLDLSSEDTPLVSIIVPAYNHAEFISDCILSILNQDYPNIDLIVINDGSTDDTDQIIKALLEKYSFSFRYIAKNNEGLIKTLNHGIKLALGKYLCEIASDDILLPGSISKRVHYLKEHSKIDVVFADAYILDNKIKTTIRLQKDEKRYNSMEHTVKDLIEGRAKIFFPSGMFRKSLFEKLKGFDEDFRYSEDVTIWLQLALYGSIAYLDEPVMYYRTHSSNTSSSAPFKIEIRREKILALEKLLTHDVKQYEKTITKYLCREYIKYIKLSLKHPVNIIELRDTFRKGLKTKKYIIKLWYYFLLSKMIGKAA